MLSFVSDYRNSNTMLLRFIQVSIFITFYCRVVFYWWMYHILYIYQLTDIWTISSFRLLSNAAGNKPGQVLQWLLLTILPSFNCKNLRGRNLPSPLHHHLGSFTLNRFQKYIMVISLDYFEAIMLLQEVCLILMSCLMWETWVQVLGW